MEDSLGTTLPGGRVARDAPSDGSGKSRVDREWLVTNGLGGYASGSVAGVPTRCYHGYLVAALPAPLGRVVMFNHLAERITLPGGPSADLAGREQAGQGLRVPEAGHFDAFGLDAGLPVWRYRLGDALL